MAQPGPIEARRTQPAQRRQGYMAFAELKKWPADSIFQLAVEAEEINMLNQELPKLKNLRKLHILNTKGKKIKIKASANDSLEFIEISKHQDQFERLVVNSPGLKTLQLYDCQLKSLPRLKRAKQLNRLLISNSKIEQVRLRELKNHPGLRELALMFDSLRYDQIRWTPLPNLRKLNLTGNLLSHLPPDLERWDSLADLNFARNDFKYLSGGHPLPPRLNSLSFYDNDLETLPVDMPIPARLEILDLYYNKIKELPEVIGKFKNLKVLYASFNEVHLLPEWISGMDSLKALYVHHNKLTLLPEHLSRLKRLEVLHVNSNYLLHCPDWVGDYEQMNDLDLANNLMETLPLSLKKLNALEVINLRGNPFSEAALSKGEVYELLKYWHSEGVNVVR